MQVMCQSLTSLNTNPAFRAALRDTIAHSYDDPTMLLQRELRHCDTIYTATDDRGRLGAFFMTAHEQLELDETGTVDSHYVGLWATRSEPAYSAFGAAVARRWLLELTRWQMVTLRPVVVWGTTATPLVYEFASRMQPHVQPAMDGSYSSELDSIVRAIRSALKVPPPSTAEHPYVLRGIADGTRYSRDEHARVRELIQSSGSSVFEHLHIDETAGDRLLFVLNFRADLVRRSATSRCKTPR